MVNYARMEEVWRSYGPLDPIGTEEARPRRRRKVAAAGVVVVCLLGAGAGLYLQPGVQQRPRPERSPEAPATADARADARADEGALPAERADASLSEAEALEAQLQLAVADTFVPASVAAPRLGAPVSPGAAPLPLPNPVYRPPPEAPAQARRFLGMTMPSRPRAATPPARAVQAAPAPRRPMVMASVDPPLRVYPSYASPQPRPAPPPAQLAPAPIIVEEVAAPTPPEPRPSPSFDCGRARSAAERMVCESPDLSALDRRLEAEFAGAMAAGHPRELLIRDQNDWRRRRDAAAPDPRAVADAYQRRIGQLRSMQ